MIQSLALRKPLIHNFPTGLKRRTGENTMITDMGNTKENWNFTSKTIGNPLFVIMGEVLFTHAIQGWYKSLWFP
jgi:hypothetical protein